MFRELPTLSLYLHLPWCVRKCPYCDFNSHRAGESADFARYARALATDIRVEAERAGGRQVESIFLGGGTPSLFSPGLVNDILDACRHHANLAGDCEITMEANPGTVERGSLSGYRDAGVNRLSLGAQSFRDRSLDVLGRIHGPREIVEAFEEADRAGFDSINLDLMFALPGQDVTMALADLDAAIGLGPSHISWYQLTLEPNTVFHRRPPPGIPDDDLAWEIQVAGQEKLAGAGFEQYEISAYARQGRRCRHNVNYWEFGDYLAAGAGAHGKITTTGGVMRYRKPANPQSYMEQVEQGAVDAAEAAVADADLAFEFMLNALRLTAGVSPALFEARTGQPAASVAGLVSVAAAEGLMESGDEGSWRPTPRGFRFLNELQSRFLPA